MKKNLFFLLVVPIVLSGCGTYHISVKSMLEQFADTHPQTKSMLVIAPPFFYIGRVNGNDLVTINVRDKNEKEVLLPVNVHTSVRITHNNGKKKTFYFNTLLIEDSTITGSNTHFFKSPIKPIKLRDVEKIEIQRH